MNVLTRLQEWWQRRRRTTRAGGDTDADQALSPDEAAEIEDRLLQQARELGIDQSLEDSRQRRRDAARRLSRLHAQIDVVRRRMDEGPEPHRGR